MLLFALSQSKTFVVMHSGKL